MESLFNIDKANMLFKKSPLPFMGQKTRYVKCLYNILQNFSINYNTIFLDCFGGSGLLSQTIKYYYPNEVVWNDYDNFIDRLAKIPITKEIFNNLRPHIRKLKRNDNIFLSDTEKNIIHDVIDSYNGNDIDFITISVWFCFQTIYAHNKDDFKQKALYNRMPYAFNVDNYKYYLNKVSRVSCDYKELIQKYYSQKENVILILDPPYLATDSGNYKNHFNLKDTLELINVIKQFPQTIMFSSHRSSFKELLDFVGLKYTYFDNIKFNVGDNKEICFCIKGN